MPWTFWLLAASAVAVLLGFAHVAFWTWYLHVPRTPDEEHFATTEDGWRLALGRYRPRVDAGKREPVLLCHGLGANAYNVDFDQERSLARWLATRGWDVWVMEVRGIGRSRRPPPGWKRREWSFDDMVRLDIPAVLDLVRAKAGAARVHWVGHSMGGMLGYAFLQGPGADKVRSLVAVASPATFEHASALPLPVGLLRRFRGLGRVPQRSLARWLAPFAGWFHVPGSDVALAKGSLEGRIVRRVMANLAEDLPYGVAAQFAEWLRVGDFRDVAGKRSWRDGLAGVSTPTLFVAGTVDRLAVPGAVRAGFERLGTADKEYRLLGKAYGQAADYGHGDLLLSRHAPAEVFPLIEDWLLRHS
jgi:predicted alpha/beta hydrolase